MPGGTEGAIRADVVVVAAGSSRRMAGTDKLVAPIGGRPLVAWTIDALLAAPVVERLVLVTSPERVDAWRTAPWLPAGVTAVVAGGATRQQSVAAGVRHLEAVDPWGRDRPVLVHDGARPLVSTGLVTAVAEAVERDGAALPVLPVAETLKRVGQGLVIETVDRSTLVTAQTPQGARRGLLLDAWATFPPEGPREFTDEAALLEACTMRVHAIPGEPANLKVTLPDDLRRVEQALIPASVRVGFGHDSHPFGPGTGLRLGGIEIPGAPRLAGHSDGDVVLHAVADALLGAAGQGDLGRLFPADGRTPAGIDSTALLAEVVARLSASGLAPAGVDVTVIGARPKLGVRLDAMRDAIASILGLEPGTVNVKASTGNLAGDEGAGRSISARAVATLRVLA
ncbi:MAG TPA: 2-C-methyl-D-erythritol 2,4-cyclodiphosphate synthase [Candidatus Limnocylindrales bacterium]|nr:2-C-methyl-D-erythritol 2,4-cyclodiphosphate synthase [Candidatus Limnocylindrales bacterium]